MRWHGKTCSFLKDFSFHLSLAVRLGNASFYYFCSTALQSCIFLLFQIVNSVLQRFRLTDTGYISLVNFRHRVLRLLTVGY